METNWAAENLQTIRTLMERSAVYRRAMAPLMIFAGMIGVVSGIVAGRFQIDSPRGFVLFWMLIAAVILTGAFVLVRRQALKDSEPVWSPPTRRVTQAMLPPIFIGVVTTGMFAILFRNDDAPGGPSLPLFFIIFWCWLFGCAVHSAGFFMVRGIKLFAWIYVLIGCALFAGQNYNLAFDRISPNYIMAAIFGGLHLAYGIYLYFTEKRGNES